MLAKFGREQYLTLLRLKSLWNLCYFGKCLSRIRKNLLPIKAWWGAIANFNVVAAKKLMESVLFWEMFIKNL